MIINSVMLKLKNNDERTISKVKEQLLSMKGNIDVLDDIFVKSNIIRKDPNFDIFFSTKFKKMGDFNAYLTHPLHIKVSKNIGGNIESSASVCYESDE